MRIFLSDAVNSVGHLSPTPQRCWVRNALENLAKYDSQRFVKSDPLQLLNKFSLKVKANRGLFIPFLKTAFSMICYLTHFTSDDVVTRGLNYNYSFKLLVSICPERAKEKLSHCKAMRNLLL